VRFLAIPAVLALACQVAPAESPDDVVARENARVAAARKHAEEQDQKRREEMERRKRAEEEARLAQVQEEEAKRNSAKRRASAECASDRAERRRHIQEALDRAEKGRARAAELDQYIAKNCSRKQVGDHEEVSCPPDAPPELRPGGPGMPSATVQVQASADERAKNDRCQDVQDLFKK
jgi:hypothetical protein